MRRGMIAGIGAVLIGALETAGGVQELVYQGIIRNRSYPLTAGTLGAVAGALLLAAGVALLRDAPTAKGLAEAAVYVSIPVFFLIGIVTRISGWPVTAAGITFPIIVLVVTRQHAK